MDEVMEDYMDGGMDKPIPMSPQIPTARDKTFEELIRQQYKIKLLIFSGFCKRYTYYVP